LKITEKTVREVAELANLRLTEPEVARMAREMESVLGHIDKMSRLNTDEVAPMTQVLYDAGETATLREDIEHQPLSNEEALRNAPLSGNGFFKVPRVIER
jgi:aspartyl-tRNA(Asn)/glutamyl-tRNA(Gln) amidotransferase subunit C